MKHITINYGSSQDVVEVGQGIKNMLWHLEDVPQKLKKLNKIWIEVLSLWDNYKGTKTHTIWLVTAMSGWVKIVGQVMAVYGEAWFAGKWCEGDWGSQRAGSGGKGMGAVALWRLWYGARV